jgi:hypothetical protein
MAFVEGETASPQGEITFAAGEMAFAAGEIDFHKGEMAFVEGEITFHEGEIDCYEGETASARAKDGFRRDKHVFCTYKRPFRMGKHRFHTRKVWFRMDKLAAYTRKGELSGVRELLIEHHDEAVGRFDKLDIGIQRTLSKVDAAFIGLMQALTDEAKDGPRLFSFQPIDPGFLNLPKWISQKFRLTLWCEHSRVPLPAWNGEQDKRGVYELEVPRERFVKAAPFLKVLTGTLSLVLPVASSATKLLMDDAAYKIIESELDFGQKSFESVAKGIEQGESWLGQSDMRDFERDHSIRAQGAILRQLHVWLKEKNPGFGGLVRVQNKRQEFLWVHPRFESEY